MIIYPLFFHRERPQGRAGPFAGHIRALGFRFPVLLHGDVLGTSAVVVVAARPVDRQAPGKRYWVFHFTICGHVDDGE